MIEGLKKVIFNFGATSSIRRPKFKLGHRPNGRRNSVGRPAEKEYRWFVVGIVPIEFLLVNGPTGGGGGVKNKLYRFFELAVYTTPLLRLSRLSKGR